MNQPRSYPGLPAALCVPRSESKSLAPWRSLIVGALLTAYFAYFTWPTLWVHFNPDDFMNIHYYWRMPLRQQVFGPLMLWRPLYRPIAAWFLLPVLCGFGMNPAAFRVVMLAVLLATACEVYSLSRWLRCGERAALLTALIACYHVGLSNLYYNIACIYDVLCAFFYFAALLYYVRIRERELIPNWKQLTAFLCLSLAALDAKEMAVTLPAVMLIYEFLYHPHPSWRPRILVHWLLGPGRCILAGGCLTLVFLTGRVVRQGGLMRDPGYIPKLSMARVWDFQTHAFGDLFEKWQYFGRADVLAIWIAMFYIAWRRPRPVLRFACLSLLVVPLPIEFLIGRAGERLYIPMVAWAIFLSIVFVDVADGVASFLAREPWIGRLGRNRLSVTLVAAGAIFWAYRNADLKRRYVDPITANYLPETWDAFQQMQALRFPVRPNSTMVFLNDPFGTWQMYFIADLLIRDRTLKIVLNQKTPLSPEEIAKADYVFDYREGRLVRLR